MSRPRQRNATFQKRRRVVGGLLGSLVLLALFPAPASAYPRPGATERVSVASDGTEANNNSFSRAISADGRHVAFWSNASNLVPGDTNGAPDVFVHDRQTGTTERVSVASDGTEANASSSSVPVISADGRHVAFPTSASNLVPGDTNGAMDVFVRDRGPSTGVGRVSAAPGFKEFVVSGWATFSGAVVTSADDDPTDGEVGASLGGEMVAGSVIYRPESEDLLLRLELDSLPVGGAPGVIHRWSLIAGEATYEVRAARAAATALLPAAPYFALYECATGCAEAKRLSGGIGTTGTEVRVAVPLADLGLDEGADLTDIEASTALGEAATGPLVTLDDLSLPDATIPSARVDLAVAPASTLEEQVTYTTQATVSEGEFFGRVSTDPLPVGEYRVWARACLGETCGAHAIPVTL